jgi:hypothetical protein
MLEQHVPEIRQELAATRVSALRRSAEHGPVGPVRRAIGAGLVRLGLRLGYDGHVPPLVSQLRTEEPPASAGGTSSWETARAA